MNDAEADAQKARVQRYIDKWMPAGFGWWKIDVFWNRGSHEGKEGKYSAATITENWEYRSCAITFYLPQFVDLKDEEVEENVLHELSHLLIASIRDYSCDDRRQMTEFAVTCVTRAALHTPCAPLPLHAPAPPAPAPPAPAQRMPAREPRAVLPGDLAQLSLKWSWTDT